MSDEYLSSSSCLCMECGAIAQFHGTPEEINKAAQEFYRIHKQAHSTGEKE
jgi:hypothetical protein